MESRKPIGRTSPRPVTRGAWGASAADGSPIQNDWELVQVVDVRTKLNSGANRIYRRIACNIHDLTALRTVGEDHGHADEDDGSRVNRDETGQ